MKVGGWREARQALRGCPLEPRPEIQMELRAWAGPLTQQRRKDGAVHRVHQESFLLVILTGERGKDMQGWLVTSRGRPVDCSLMVESRQTGFKAPLATAVSLNCPICQMGLMIILWAA